MEDSEINRLRAELRVNKKAYANLKKEKDDLSKTLSEANSQILKLNEELDIRERLFSEYRENKEKEYTELLMIKQDLEMRLKSALEMDEDNDQTRLSLSIGRNQAWWSSQSSSTDPQLTCTDAMDALKCWEGMDATIKLFNELLRNEEDGIQWKPGTAWNDHCKWKPHLKIYISTGPQVFPEIEQYVLPELEAMCKTGGSSVSCIGVSLNESLTVGLNQDTVIELCQQEVTQCDIFIGIIHTESDSLIKTEVEYGFINNPAARPSLFVFLNSKSTANIKLKQRITKLSNFTKIIESNSFSQDVVKFLINEGKNVLKTKFDIFQPIEDQKKTFEHLSILSDMRVEYEQYDILHTLHSRSPDKPTGIDVTLQNLTAYMNDEQLNVAPYLITAPPGVGKSTLLSKWYQYLQEQESGDSIEVLYHFIPQSCSSHSETCVMYRRFIQKLINLCGHMGTVEVPTDPNKLEETFTQLLDMTSARLKTLDLNLVFILIDNVDQLVELKDVGWILKPLPQNIRVILTANDGSTCPDSWRALPVSTLPSPTATDLQEVISEVTFGAKGQKLSEDQVLSLTISSSSDSSQLWCVMAAKYILSACSLLSESEVDDLIESLSEAEEIPELARLSVDGLTTRHSDIIGDTIDRVLQLIYWSRNGLSLKELKICTCSDNDTVLLYVLSELHKLHILYEVSGLYRFTNESVQQLVNFKYVTDFDHLVHWSDILISHFTDLSRQPLARATSEILWLLKRSERHNDLMESLLNIDILTQLYCGGESSLLLRYWNLLRVNSTEIPLKYYNQVILLEEQAANDQSMLLYVAMLFCTTGKILKDLGFGLECQSLLRHSLELCEVHSEPDSMDIGNSMYELASLYAETNRYSAAESFYKQSLEVFEHVDDSKEILKVLSALSVLYELMKRPDLLDTVTPQLYAVKEKNKLLKPNALSLLKKRADELEDLLTEFEDSDIPSESDILAMNEWSLLHATFGDKKVSEKYLLSNLQKGEEVLGEEHPVTMILIKNMITFYQQINNFKDAIPLQTHLVELKERKFGQQHTSVGAAHNNLAIFYCCVGEYKTAIHHYDCALAIYNKLYGHNHSLVQDTLANRDLAELELNA